MNQRHSLVILSCLLATCSTVSHAKRAASVPKQLTPPRLPIKNRGRNFNNNNAAVSDIPPRGGGAVKPLYTAGRVPIELNPNYVPPQWRRSQQQPKETTDASSSAAFSHEHTPYVAQETTLAHASSTSAAGTVATDYRAGWSATTTHYNQGATWLENLKIQFLAMYRSSPSLTASMVACLAVFLAWQVQPRSGFLQRYFVLSRANMQHVARWPSLVLSAVSHMDIWHLLVNLYALWSLGPSVQRSLQQVGQPLGPFLGGAAVASSGMFLLLQRLSGAGGALGLSGVTLALLGVYARIHPTAILGVRLAGIIPVRLKAENLLVCLGAWSLVGAISTARSNIGHAAHLGGILFGVAYHQFVLQRAPVRPTLWEYHP